MNVVYFTDRDLGIQFPRILSGAGLKVERHTDHFAHDAPDDEWLAAAGAKGWIALTHNSRIRYTPNEKEAVIVRSSLAWIPLPTNRRRSGARLIDCVIRDTAARYARSAHRAPGDP